MECIANRAFVVLHLLRDKKNGLGNVFPEEILDLDSFVEGAADHDRLVTGPDGPETIDRCDVMINEAQSGWDLIKQLLYEGRALIIPGAKFRYKVEKARAPGYAFQFPGNVVAGSVTVQKGVERRINTIRGNYSDEADNFKTQPFVHQPDIGEDPERVEQVSFISLTRKSNVAREARFRLKKAQNALRYSYKTPPGRDTPELLDTARLSYETPNSRRGFSGFVQGASTVSSIVLDRMVTLEEGATYDLQIFHKETKTTELRTITTPAGTVAIVETAEPFAELIPGKDLWAIGKQNVHIQKVLIEAVELEAEGAMEWQASLYDPSIYELDEEGEEQLTPPGDINPVKGEDTLSPPPPVIQAQAVEVPDGPVAWRFTIAPGFDPLQRSAQAVSADTVTLSLDEPAIDDFFATAQLTIDGQTRTVTAYNGATRVATLAQALSPVPPPGPYVIRFLERAATAGFRVEKSADAVDWEPLAAGSGNELVVDGQEASFAGFFRFTPRSALGHENTRGRWVVQLSAGDTEAPAPPLAVALSSFEKSVQVNIDLSAPVARDTEKILVELRRSAADGDLVAEATLPVVRNDTLAGTVRFSYFKQLSDEEFGAVIFARAKVADYFGNQSAFTAAEEGTTLIEVADDGDQPEADLMNYAHEWSAAREYQKNDVVIFLGETYIALEPSIDIEPDSDPYVWQILGVHEATPGSGEGDVATDPIWEAKGDLAVALGDSDAVRLAVGSNGQVLTADSAEATGLKWASPAGGGAAWALVGSWTHSSDVPNVDFTGLGAYTEILVIARNITTGGSTFRAVRVSTDNGSTFFATSGDYKNVTGAGVEGNNSTIGLHASASTAARSGGAIISPFNIASAVKAVFTPIHLQSQNGSGMQLFVGSSDPLNAIRVHTFDGSNFTAGSIFVFGR